MRNFVLLGLDGACPGIIEQAIEDGRMPNLKRLRDRGCCADNIPFPSAVTPGNWDAIATGARPATIGISDFAMHTPGLPLDEKHDVFTKAECNAEFLWDAYSDRGYKVASIAYPGSLPQTKPNHLAIGNSGNPGENTPPHGIARNRGVVTGGYQPKGPYDWKEYEEAELAPPTVDPGVPGFVPRYELKLTIAATNSGFSGEHSFILSLGLMNGKPAGVVLDSHTSPSSGSSLPFGVREWSPYFAAEYTRHFEPLRRWIKTDRDSETITGEFRVRIVHLDLDKAQLVLYIGSVYPKYAFTSNPDETRPLRDKLGPYADDLPESRFLIGCLDEEGWYDEFRLQAIWEARAAVELVNNMGYKGVFTKWHAFDKYYHFLMNRIDPIAPDFNPDEFEYYEGLHNRLIEIADEAIGVVLDSLNDDTDLIVISDHGLMASRRSVWVNRLLAQNGYINYEIGPDGNAVVDWSRTRAFVSAFMILNANLKGRDPHGVVEPGEEHEALKVELIELLRGLKDPENGRHVMSEVFDPAKDGAFYGMGSELDGDVRYFTVPGYTLYRSIRVDGEDVVTDVVGDWHGDHGSCRPTTRYGRGGEVGIFYAAGKGFKHLPKRAMPIFPCDVVPTLLHLAGQPATRTLEGRVLHDLLA
jgi:predicted AlkP superfamily phosphohydrolase/phosphomutase